MRIRPPADAQDACQPTGEQAHDDREPGRAGDAGALEMHHGGNLEGLQLGGPVQAHGRLVKLLLVSLGFAFLSAAQGHVMKDQPGQQHQQHHIEPAHDLIHFADAFQPHDHLRAGFPRL